MDKTLDRILESYVAKPGETAGKNQLLGAAYVVVNKDGESNHSPSTHSLPFDGKY